MEVLHGVFKRQNTTSALFMFREPSFIPLLPKSLKDDFVDSDDNRKKLTSLKNEISKRFSKQVINYNWKWDGGINVTTSKPNTSGLEEFAKNVLDYFKDAISYRYPYVEEPANPIEISCSLQTQFIEEKARSVINTTQLSQQIDEFLKILTSDKSIQHIVFNSTRSGIGLTTLLAS